MLKRLFFSIAVFAFIASLTFGVISFGRGYRFNVSDKTLSTTGILSVSSYPEKSSIWIDGKLVSATNASISLAPGWYEVRISKEGYQDWKKKVRVQGEIVSQIDALLIPGNPSLRALTTTGALSPELSPGSTKIAYLVPPEDATSSSSLKLKEGVWILELRTGPLGGKSEPKLLYQPIATYTWKNARLHWSNDEKQIILTFVKIKAQKETLQTALQISTETTAPPVDVTSSYASKLALWQEEFLEKRSLQISNLNPLISDIFSKSTANIRFSPDEMKVLYLATSSAALSQVLTPPLIGSNPTEEVRKIKPDKYFVYDIKEDKNFFITDKNNVTSAETPLWYADSKHIITIEKDIIYITDYDGTNKRAAYAGPFEENIAFPWPSGNRLTILTNLNRSNSLSNLYEVDLR